MGIYARKYLNNYCKAFNAVEVDAAFYCTPKSGVVQHWAADTLDHLVFCLKMPKVITHELGILRSTAYVQEFIDSEVLLGDKLGVVLIQLPPTFRSSRMPILESFVQDSQDDIRFAVEFRDQSWYTSKSTELLKNNNNCWEATEYKGLPKTLPATADYFYVRFIGRHGRFDIFNQVRIDTFEKLAWWQRRFADLSPKIDVVYGYFNNDYAGYAPATCNKFKSMLKLQTVDLEPPKQERLF